MTALMNFNEKSIIFTLSEAKLTQDLIFYPTEVDAHLIGIVVARLLYAL